MLLTCLVAPSDCTTNCKWCYLSNCLCNFTNGSSFCFIIKWIDIIKPFYLHLLAVLVSPIKSNSSAPKDTKPFGIFHKPVATPANADSKNPTSSSFFLLLLHRKLFICMKIFERFSLFENNSLKIVDQLRF